MKVQKRESLLFALAIALILVVLVATLPSASYGMLKQEQLTPVNDGWYYMKDGVKTALTLPTTLRYTGEEPLTIYNDTLTQEAAGTTLTTRGVQHGLTASMNGQVLYRYSDEYFPRNSQMKSKYECDVLIPPDTQVGVLEVTFERESSGRYVLSSFYIGNGSAVMRRHFTNSIFPVSLAFVFLLLSLTAVGVSIYLHFTRIEHKRFLDTAAFLFVLSIWVFTDTPLIQVQVGNPAAVCTVSFYAFMLLAVPMLYFIKHTPGLEKYRVLDWFIRLFFLNAVVQGVLHLAFGIDFRDMLFVTHLLLTSGVGISIILLVREYIRNKGRDIGMTLVAFALLGTSGVLAIVLYWILRIPYYGTIFEVGNCLFVLILIGNIVINMAENIHYRTEMQVFQRLLCEDRMTGMGSQQPFDDHLTAIQRNPEAYKNAALIFFRVKNLKTTNEESGHAAGDELVLGAAKCISETFGQAGRCYRLKGDEFSVILEDTQEPEEDWFRRFDLAIQKFNRNNRYWLSVARGWSNLRNDDGSLKTISNWKFSANTNLH